VSGGHFGAVVDGGNTTWVDCAEELDVFYEDGAGVLSGFVDDMDFDDAFTASSLECVDDFVFSFGEVATEPLSEVIGVVGVG
jgi:hypothetical protein